MSPEIVIIVVGALVGVSCALVGTFLVLRKMSLIGDAISHAVLPGIAIAFLVTSSRAQIPMIIGAATLGVVTVFLIEILYKTKRVGSDASIGVIFPALFAVGIIIISKYVTQVDLDLDCVLYGEIAYAPWDTLIVAGNNIGPKAIWVVGTVTLLNLFFVLLFYKELKLSTFDPGLAKTLGISPSLMHYMLMGMVSLTTVAAFESVGAILVVAMLIVPAAAAYLLTDSLGIMIVISVIFGALSSLFGYQMAHAFDASIAGAMATTAGIIFLLSWILSPTHGLLSKIIRHHRMRRRVAQRLLLGHLYSIEKAPTIEAIINRFQWSESFARLVIRRLKKHRFLSEQSDAFLLTETGRGRAEALSKTVS